MKNKTHFSTKELEKVFSTISIGDVFEKDGKRYQYTGKDDNGNIAAVFLKPGDTNHSYLVGSQIKKTRIGKVWNQTQLAESAGLRVATISDIESGKANVQINTLSQIAIALNCYLGISFTPIK
jgi:DNA-binding Xre family transcriptional regulator